MSDDFDCHGIKPHNIQCSTCGKTVEGWGRFHSPCNFGELICEKCWAWVMLPWFERKFFNDTSMDDTTGN